MPVTNTVYSLALADAEIVSDLSSARTLFGGSCGISGPPPIFEKHELYLHTQIY